jgi:hypothetical protein
MTQPPFTLDTEAAPPPQQTSAAFRVVARSLGLPAMWLLQLSAAISRRIGPHRVSGRCQGSGGCCRYISLDWPSSLRSWTRLRRALVWWYQQVHGFFPRHFVWVGDDEEIEVFACRHLRADNRCAEYRLRPLVCRLWPNPFGAAPPVLNKGCGYTSGPSTRALPILADEHTDHEFMTAGTPNGIPPS